jgi:hypothetical protein
MAAVDLLVPLVAKIHWDDLLRKFTLKISEEFLRSQGNKRDSDSFDLPTLAAVLAEILNIWANIAFLAEGELTYELGDVGPLIDRLTLLQTMAPAVAIPEMPDPYEDDSAYDDHGHADPTDWGETP